MNVIAKSLKLDNEIISIRDMPKPRLAGGDRFGARNLAINSDALAASRTYPARAEQQQALPDGKKQ